jgi:hypothetical protein
MTLEQTWTASAVKPTEFADTDLSGLVGKWPPRLEVRISNPATIRQGPIQREYLESWVPTARPSRDE